MEFERVVLFGHSFVSHFVTFLSQNGPRTPSNFNLPKCKVTYLGESSRKVGQLCRSHLESIAAANPQLVFIMMGDNDLGSDCTASEVGHRLLSWVTTLKTMCVGAKVVICQVFPRFTNPSHPYHSESYNKKAIELNSLLAQETRLHHDIYFLQFEFVVFHEAISEKFRAKKRFFVEKGIHLNPTGYFRLHRELRQAIIALK